MDLPLYAPSHITGALSNKMRSILKNWANLAQRANSQVVPRNCPKVSREQYGEKLLGQIPKNAIAIN
jgi:hypothetical protein